jgi:predicted RNA-binding protein with PIN domain
MLAGLVGEPTASRTTASPQEGDPGAAVSPAVVPRGVAPAVPGRPCLLPSGIVSESSAAVEALLQVDELELLLDGYNLTKDLRGRPSAPLPEQRVWLLRAVAAVAATRPVRPTIVFDGQGGTVAGSPSARGVRTVFTHQDELADDRIKDYVAAMADSVPVLVVTSDREVRDSVGELGANVVSSGMFLKAIGASS